MTVITPPPELVQQWDDQGTAMFRPEYQMHLATRAAQWGADQELEACCEWLRTESKTALWQTEALRVARRPKPPSLKEQALEAQQRLTTGAWRAEDWQLISRALEALPDA